MCRSDWSQAKPQLPPKLGLAEPSASCGVFSTVNRSKSRSGLRLRTFSSSWSFSLPRVTSTLATGVLPGAARQLRNGVFGNRSNDVEDGLEPAAPATPPAATAAKATAATARRARVMSVLMGVLLLVELTTRCPVHRADRGYATPQSSVRNDRRASRHAGGACVMAHRGR